MASAFRRKIGLLLALLLAAAAAYAPAWYGGVLWDDDRHLTSAALQSADGLRRIWFEPGATQQYYPLAHSAFWLMHQLWGHATLGYHLVNIALHAFSAFLIALILRRLAIPGAVLAAVIFALHPVHVESVAWITELKNTLSGVLYLGAALAYLRFDDDFRLKAEATTNGGILWLPLTLFVLALLTKTVTATLPAALLIVAWWMRGRISWRRDVRPLVPFFILGAAGGLTTVWVERTFIGAQGGEFAFTFIERCLIAGRAIWFYLTKLVWPVDLIFIYPRWQIDAATWWQYLYPAAALAMVAVLWRLRHWSRAPLAAFLVFAATLFPALGFFNVYPFRFSFVADHFQYLASIPIIAFVSAVIATGVARTGVARNFSSAMTALTLVFAAVLGTLTYAQSRQYQDAETQYRTTLARNPSAWMAHVNLGMLKIETDVQGAAAHFRDALRLKPDIAEAHSNLGITLHRSGKVTEAVSEYREALRLDPRLAQAHANLCTALNQLGRPGEAAAACAEAIRLEPDFTDAHFNLGVAAQALGRPEAAGHFRDVLRLKPDLADAHNRLGVVLQQGGRLDDAKSEYEAALRLRPDFAEAHNNLGALFVTMARHREALVHFSEAVRVNPRYADAHFNLANLLQNEGRLDDAVMAYRNAIEYAPNDFAAHNNLGVALERLGRRREAAAAFSEALRIKPESAQARENLGRVR